jgi:hypothetical protein
LNPAANLSDVNNFEVRIAPNPAANNLAFSAPQDPTNIEIYNAQGQKMSGSWSSNSSQQLDINHLDSGVYILELQFSNTAKSIRFIKE